MPGAVSSPSERSRTRGSSRPSAGPDPGVADLRRHRTPGRQVLQEEPDREGARPPGSGPQDHRQGQAGRARRGRPGGDDAPGRTVAARLFGRRRGGRGRRRPGGPVPAGPARRGGRRRPGEPCRDEHRPRQPAAPVPDGVAHEEACYATLCAIALHGVRLSRPELARGAQSSGSAGRAACRAVPHPVRCTGPGARFRPRPPRSRRTSRRGSNLRPEGQGPAGRGHGRNRRRGLRCGGHRRRHRVERPRSRRPAQVARDRAIVSLVGYTGTTFPYREFMHKELTVTVSRSYGPGRYDPDLRSARNEYPPASCAGPRPRT